MYMAAPMPTGEDSHAVAAQRPLFGAGQCGQEHSRQNGNDRYHHEQFNHVKAPRRGGGLMEPKYIKSLREFGAPVS